MRTICRALLLIGLLPCGGSRAQTGTLYYFKGKSENTWGVKDKKGKVIIPAQYKSYSVAKGDTVQGSLIFLMDSVRQSPVPGPASYGLYFDRAGSRKVRPYWFDNGPDLNVEGLFRFVDGRRMGFADRSGNVVIPARHSYADPFEYGYSFFCDGCTWYRDTAADPEHNLRLGPGQWGLMDKTGKSLLMLGNEPVHQLTDSLLKAAGQDAPYKTATETEIISTLLKAVPNLDSVLSRRGTGTTQTVEYETFVYKIVEEPAPGFPYYAIAAYTHRNGAYRSADAQFLVEEKTGKVYFQWYAPEDMEPIADWLKR
jgi:hypothetical protein